MYTNYIILFIILFILYKHDHRLFTIMLNNDISSILVFYFNNVFFSTVYFFKLFILLTFIRYKNLKIPVIMKNHFVKLTNNEISTVFSGEYSLTKLSTLAGVNELEPVEIYTTTIQGVIYFILINVHWEDVYYKFKPF